MTRRKTRPQASPGTSRTDPPGRPTTGSGKVANDHNQPGQQPPTQRNEARRTPESRHDRENLAGSHNQNRSRQGGPGSSQR